MKALPFFFVLAIAIGNPVRAAWAVDRAACFDAASEGQTQRDAHKLIDARDKFRLCAQPECPASMRGDCAVWLAEVDKSVPTVVLSAKSAAGTDYLDLRAQVDSTPFQDALDGQARPVDPGEHTFRFVTRDGTSIEQRVLVVEGEKDISVVVVVPSLELDVRRRRPAPQTLRTVAWAVGAGGVAALATGIVAGVVAVADKGAAHCDAANRCDGPALNEARGAATVADVSLGTGGVLLGTALVLFLLPPKSEPGATLALAPALSSRSAGLSFGGSW